MKNKIGYQTLKKFRRYCVITLTAFFLFLAFRELVETIISTFFVAPILSYVSTLWYNDVIFLFFTGVVIYMIWKAQKYRRLSLGVTCFLLLVGIPLFLYRLFWQEWTFTSSFFFPFFKYIDFIFLIIMFRLPLHFKRMKKNESQGQTLIDDKPIKNAATEDLLGYRKYAATIAEKIDSSTFSESFAFGINAAWGMGKTSFINLVKEKIQSKDIIEVNFKPWNSNSPDAIIRDFFETFQDSIKPYHSSLSFLFSQYSTKLVDLHPNSLTQAFQSVVSLLTGGDAVGYLYDRINASLKLINRKIIIYIDDLDRLEKEEVMEVLKLIRNTANFHNTVFVVAYDKNYVVDAIKNHNSVKHRGFLEKIFQVEITLPYFPKVILLETLAKKLKTNHQDYNGLHKAIDDLLLTKGYTHSTNAVFENWIVTMRDVNRLVNSLFINFENLIGEVHFQDFLRIELFRLNYPQVHDLLFRHKKSFFELEDKKSRRAFYRLKSSGDLESNGFSTYLHQHLSENLKELSLTSVDVDKIESFLDSLFNQRNSITTLDHSPLSIVFPSKFNRYFAYVLLDGSLSEVEFSKARDKSQKEFNSLISQWVQHDLEWELQMKFEEILEFDDRDDYEKVIRAIFHLAKLPSQNPSYFRKFAYYDTYDIIIKLKDYKGSITQSFYSNKDAKTLKNFVTDLFKSAPEPFVFEAKLAQKMEEDDSQFAPLTIDELKQIRFEYLKSYLSSQKKLNDDSWTLYYSCFPESRVNREGLVLERVEEKPEKNEANSILKNFITHSDFDGLLEHLVVKDRDHDDRIRYSVKRTALNLYNDWNNFESMLGTPPDSLKDVDLLREFKSLFLKFKENNYSQIGFECPYMPED